MSDREIMTPEIKKLEKICREAGIDLEHKGNGHYQIKGPLLVNYYPISKSKTAYVARTKKGKKNCNASEAFGMAFTAPEKTKNIDQRSKGSRKKREKLLMHNSHCYWCDAKITLDTSTLEHIIPLARGGLDNPNNYALACPKCNHDRGSDMPELEVKK